MTNIDERKTNDSTVIKAGAGYLLGNILLKGISFLSGPIFSRLLSTSDYGDFNTYISYEAIVYVLVGIALHVSINNARYKYSDCLDEYVSSIILLIFSSFLIWMVVTNIFYPIYGVRFGFSRGIANVLIVHCLCSSLLQVYSSYVAVFYKYKSYVRITAFNAIFNLVFSVVLILTIFNGRESIGRIVGTVVPMLFIGIGIVVYFFRKAKPHIVFSFWKYALGYSIPLVPHGIAQIVLSSFDRIMIRDMVGSSESGIYSFAFLIVSILNVVATSIENAWKPWVYECMNAKRYLDIKRRGNELAAGMGVITVLLVGIAPELIKILGPKEYWGATECVVPILVGAFFVFMYYIPALIEFYYEKTKYIAIGSTSAAVLNIVLNYIFIQRYGYVAAAYTTLVTYALYFMAHYFIARMIHKEKLFDSFSLFGISIIVVTLSAVFMFLEGNVIIRWLLVVVISIIAFIWAEKNFQIVSWVNKKIGRE